MATRRTPPPTEAKADLSPPEKQTDAKVSLEKVFAEVTKMSKTLQLVAADTIAIKETMTELKDMVNGLQVRMDSRGLYFTTGGRDRRTGDRQRC